MTGDQDITSESMVKRVSTRLSRMTSSDEEEVSIDPYQMLKLNYMAVCKQVTESDSVHG